MVKPGEKWAQPSDTSMQETTVGSKSEAHGKIGATWNILRAFQDDRGLSSRARKIMVKMKASTKRIQSHALAAQQQREVDHVVDREAYTYYRPMLSDSNLQQLSSMRQSAAEAGVSLRVLG